MLFRTWSCNVEWQPACASALLQVYNDETWSLESQSPKFIIFRILNVMACVPLLNIWTKYYWHVCYHILWVCDCSYLCYIFAGIGELLLFFYTQFVDLVEMVNRWLFVTRWVVVMVWNLSPSQLLGMGTVRNLFRGDGYGIPITGG